MSAPLFLAIGFLPAPDVEPVAVCAGGSVYELSSPSKNLTFEMVPSFQNSNFSRQQAKRVSFPDSGDL